MGRSSLKKNLSLISKADCSNSISIYSEEFSPLLPAYMHVENAVPRAPYFVHYQHKVRVYMGESSIVEPPDPAPSQIVVYIRCYEYF